MTSPRVPCCGECELGCRHSSPIRAGQRKVEQGPRSQERSRNKRRARAPTCEPGHSLWESGHRRLEGRRWRCAKFGATLVAVDVCRCERALSVCHVYSFSVKLVLNTNKFRSATVVFICLFVHRGYDTVLFVVEDLHLSLRNSS